jgi:hypothetical protein
MMLWVMAAKFFVLDAGLCKVALGKFADRKMIAWYADMAENPLNITCEEHGSQGRKAY